MTDNTPQTENPAANEITKNGKLWAGILLTSVTTIVIYFIIGYWPDKMPSFKDGDDAAWYNNKLFNISLIEKTDCMVIRYNDSLSRISASLEKNISIINDTINSRKDSPDVKKYKDSLGKLETTSSNLKKNILPANDKNKIHLNTILLLLVALMGFLGNMIHVASSFTAFVGNGTFRRNWILWYYVKPFTAAALAIIIYFIIRAGFLSYGSSASGISLYGILSLSALAGLFTDAATLKLKEVFEVIFKPKDERTGKLQGDDTSLSITTITPDPMPSAGEITLTLTGKNLNIPDIKILIDKIAVVPSTVTADKMEIKYTPTPGAVAAGKAVLLINDKDDKKLYTKDITVK